MVVGDKSHAKIMSRMIKGRRLFALVVILRLLGGNAIEDNTAELFRNKWEVYADFKTKKFSDSFKIHFKSMSDFERVRLVEWTWYKQNVLLILPWT